MKQNFKPRQELVRSHTVSYQESQGSDTIKSFDCPKEHLEFHLNNMKHLCKNVEVKVKKG